jgi:ketol-acid reductoisomerase
VLRFWFQLRKSYMVVISRSQQDNRSRSTNLNCMHPHALNIYHESDTDLSLLQARTIAVIGYGSQGHAHALNLRDSGLQVVVGLREGGSWQQASEAGFRVLPVAGAVQQADFVMILVNDEYQPQVYSESIQPFLRNGMALAFAHGFNIHFGQISPPPDIDVLMVSPKGVGRMVRQLYQEGRGVPALIAIQQDYSGQAKPLALAYAAGLGCARAGIYETTFRDECECDLFGEQVVLCGGASALIQAAYDTLVEAGYPPEVAYFECVHELKLIVDLIHEMGISGMRTAISDTAQYGDMTRGPRIIDEHVRDNMRLVLAEIQSGQFAREWIEENREGRKTFNALAQVGEEHPVEQIGREIRSRMNWMNKNRRTKR